MTTETLRGTQIKTPLSFSGIIIPTDIYTNEWANYASSSTIVGWASFTNKVIYVERVGKLVFVQFYLNGTSNSTAVSFTLPYAQQAGVPFDQLGGAVQDGGVWQSTACEISFAVSATTVNIYKTFPSVAWTNTGAKTVLGQFWYHTS